ncbi:MAG: PqqD family protein [Lachnospiraceae bacterium]|nr:PqqD family protein [Lachnospiraceae bacterium]
MSEPKYQTQPEFILREIGDEAVLVPVGAVGELENSIINFNETYSFIWKQFEEPHTISEAIENARREYEAPEGVIEEQVKGAVDELIKRGVLKAV